MYNHKKAQIRTHEKMLREHPVDPSADDKQAIWEKELKHWQGDKDTITEDQMNSTLKQADTNSTDVPIIEKILNERESYIVHRSDAGEISTPPMSALVEFNRQERMEDWETTKEPHWSQTINEKKQQGTLPKWPKNVGQHEKIVLNNDPRRFQDKGNLPTSTSQAENDAGHGKKPKIKPLTGDLTTADAHLIAEKIKTGYSVEYDAAILAFLRDAEREKRELTDVEKRTISNLKMARTKAMLKK